MFGAHRMDENGRHKPPQGPWLMQHHPSMKQIMAIMAERDAAIQERNLALSEKKIAIAERDMAALQRDSAIADRNNVLKERDNAIAALQYRERESSVNNNNNVTPQCPPGCQIERGVKHMHHPQQSMNHLSHIVDQDQYNVGRSTLHKGDNPIPMSTIAPEPAKSARRPKRPKEANRRTTKPSKKVIKQDFEDHNKTIVVFKPSLDWKPGSSESWKDQDLSLNQVSFDETTMPVPVCSCTGSLRPCYKWGNGGWQSSCCTTNLSMYPLPAMPNKRHARVGGRKMSGSAFNKLISRLAAEGQDLSNPVDLKENWAKHGTNRYITIK